MFDQQRQEAELRRLQRIKSLHGRPAPLLGEQVVGFFKSDVEKRHKRFGKIAEVWQQLVPQLLQEHCCLESFAIGSLTVLVDSSSHLYELKQLLLAGLEQQLLLACRASKLRKIILRAGRWYSADEDGGKTVRFG